MNMASNPEKRGTVGRVKNWFGRHANKSKTISSAVVIEDGQSDTPIHDSQTKPTEGRLQSEGLGDAASLRHSSQKTAEQSLHAPSSSHMDLGEEAHVGESITNDTKPSSVNDCWPDTLWDEAYKEIRKTNPTLLIAYQKYLLKQEDGNQQADDLGSAEGQAHLQELVVNKLDDIKESRLRIPIYAKKVNGEYVVKKVAVRDQVCNIVRGIQSVSGFIGAAVSPSPPAALAWAGVLVLLPVFLNAVTKDDDAMEGLKNISDLLVRCKVREDTYRKRIAAATGKSESQNLKDLHRSLAKKNVELYSNILKYQIQLAIHYHGGLLRRSVGDFVVSNDWKGMMTDLETATEKINQDLSEDDRNMITEELLNLREKSEKSMDLLKDIQDRIKGISQDSLLRELPRERYAAFDSYQNPRETTSLHRTCLEGTRVDIRSKIQHLLQDPDDRRCVFWLKGMPGTGKSTIARTIATSLALEGRLGGSFFLSRGRLNPHNATQLFTTLASQITDVIPDVRPYVCSAIEEKRDIGGKQLSEQWDRLILKPLLALDGKLQKGLYPSFALILVIDALDECENDEDVEEIVRLFSEIEGLKIIHLRVFMTSRPENFLRAKFSQVPKHLRFDMDLSKVSHSNAKTDRDDITKLMEFELAKLRTRHNFPEDWPGEENIEQLARKADGLFIYAATACRFLSAGTTKTAIKFRLETIFNDEVDSNSPQQSLDNIYTQILRFSVVNKIERERKEIYKLFKQILGPIILLFHPLSIDGLSKLLSISKVEKVEIEDILRDLYSVIDVPQSQTAPIQSLHLSFPEFLLDHQRCPKEFVIDRTQTHDKLVDMCLFSMFQILKRDICDLKKPGILSKDVKSSVVESCLPGHIQYACRSWIGHLLQSDIELRDNSMVHKFFKEHFLHWLEALGLLGSVYEGVRMILALSERLSVVPVGNQRDLHTVVHDAKRFLFNYKSILEIAPLQVYSSALVFSPMKSCIRVTYSRDAPDWIKSIPNLPMSWNASQHVIECASFSPKIALSRDGQFLAYTSKTSHQVDLRDPKTGDLRYTLNSDKIYTYTCLEFSPDSKFLACAAWNPRVELWDLKTRKVRVLEGHSNGVHALAFSSDGELLVTASDDKSVRLWDPHTGASKAVFTGHSHVVRTVVFSPNNQLIVSASYGQNIRLWSPITQEACGILRGHLDMISAVAVSPDNQYIASGSRDKTVRLWDLNNLTSIELIGHSDYISAVIFSPDGQLLVSGDFDGMIGLWHPVTGVSLAILKHHSSAISRLSFFPDSRFFGSASNDKTVRIWDTTRRVLHTTFEGHSDSVYDVKISHDSRLVASVSSDRTVRLWYPQAETQSIEFERHTNTVSDISFSPNGQLVASSAYDGTIKLWDPSTGTLYRTLVGHEYHFTGLVEFSPNGEILASADRYVIRLWDPITGVPLKTLNIGFGWINKLSFSPTSKLLASGAGQGNNNHWAGMKATVGMMQGEENPATYKNVRVWDTSTGSCCCVFSCDVDEGNRGSTELEAFVFSEDEKLLAALTYGRVWIWNLETKELVQKLDRQDVALHQPNASLVLESERDRDILTRTFPGICLDQPRLDPPLYVDEEWVTWRTERVLWIPPDYRPTCVGVRDSILVIGHGSGRLTFIEFDLDKIPFCGSPGGEIWGTGIAT